MKKLSLQWRITLMTALLIGATCIFMNVLIGYSGSHYMDSIGSYVTGYGDTDKGEPDFFDPEHEKLDRELTIVINGILYRYQLVYYGGGNIVRRCACVFFKRACAEASAYFYRSG